jgi:hypothetical protein
LGNFYYPSTLSTTVYTSVVIHLGKTATGGGNGTVGSFSPVNTAGGMKRILWLRNKDDGTDRFYWSWPTADPSAISNDLQCDTINGHNFDDYFAADFGVGQDVRWTFRLTRASSQTALDGIIQVWRDGVLVLDNQQAELGERPFQQLAIVVTRWNGTQDESEYWKDLVVWGT